MDEKIRAGLKEIISNDKLTYNQIVDQILALIKEAGYVKLADGQTLPKNSFAGLVKGRDERVHIYYGCQQDMLKAGWRKVEVKNE